MTDPDAEPNAPPVHVGDYKPSRSRTLLNPKPRRSILLALVVFGLTGLLILLAQKMGPLWVISTPEQQQAQDRPPSGETSTQNAVPVENVKTPEPSKSLVLDAAQSYLAARTLGAKK
jgi:hypothetical protein